MTDTTHAADCSCCHGIEARTPAAIENRPGLDAVAYRIGAHGDFLASMEARLSAGEFPALAALLTRDPRDPSIALLDAFASAADVLTFYQERIANEAFLRTATERRSLVELARLIDYRLKPGVAAEVQLAFLLEEAPGAPRRVQLDAGIRVQSQPGPGERPQSFETVEAIEARVEWNALKPETFRPHLPFSIDCYLEGVDLNLRPGDALLFAGEEAEAHVERDNWDIRFLEAVDLDIERNLTHVRSAQPLGSVVPFVRPAANPQVYVFRRRAAVFGHNAPLWRSMSREFKNEYDAPRSSRTEWPDYALSPEANSVDLDVVVPQVMAGSWLALSRPGYVELFHVTAVTETSRAEFAISGKVTRARLEGENYELFANEVRGTTVLAAPEQLRFAGRPVLVPVFGAGVTLASEAPDLASGVEGGRALAFSGRRAHYRVTAAGEALNVVTSEATRKLRLGELLEVMAPPVRIIGGQAVPATADDVAARTVRWQVRDAAGSLGSVNAGPGGLELRTAPLTAEVVSEVAWIEDAPDAVLVRAGRTRIALTAALAQCYDLASLALNANVARATHGEAVTQILGSGDASKTHQRFALKSLPLTFVRAENETGATSTITVRVNDVAWPERPNFIDAGPRDRGYTLRVGDEAQATIDFGDGVRGTRLPTGRENVIATYRRGIGAAGNVDAGKLSQLMTRPLGLKAVTNPEPAAGGTDADDEASARRLMPLGVRTLGRAVSLRDYEDFARAFTGIGKAHAAVLNLRAGRTIVITVAGDDGTALTSTHPTVVRLVVALRSSGDPLVRFEVRPHRDARFALRMRIKRDPAYTREAVLAAVEARLHEAFAFATREFGQPVARSEVIAVADGVPGVIAVDLDSFYRGPKRSLQTRIAAELPHVDAGGGAVAAELLTLAPGPLALLGEMP